ncbi:MAG: HpcH/HpaI aldolase/citrate lyase family protein [Hyphomicrobiales bacterium]|nr:HpcH/HpaI aldolase/citrate lyase family protein [Hyphomicrobiales bacterium]
MDMPVNRFKAALARGEQQIGLWSSIGTGAVAEALGYCGFDWILVDTEHSPSELGDVFNQLQGLAPGTATPIVRPAWNDAVLLKRFLDIGAQSFLIPWVQDADEAARAVRAVRYPPKGLRGVAINHRANHFGRVADYLQRANEQICLLVQVETLAAAAEVEAIAAVDGVDGIFIGPSDLAADMGHLGNNRHPDVQDAISVILERCKTAGKPAGILTGVEEDAKAFLEAGFTFVAVGADMGLLVKHADALARRFGRGG